MSTKIYTGFILPEATLEQALEKIHVLRRHVQSDALLKCARMVAWKATYVVDTSAAASLYGGETVPAADSPSMTALLSIQERAARIKREGRRDPQVDFEFEIVLLPQGGDILGISYVEQEEWHRTWLATDGVEEFAYWNNTDPPDELGLDDWLERERRWDEALAPDPSGRPGHAGLTATLHGTEPPFPKIEDIESALPSFEIRCQIIAKDALRSGFLRDTRLALDATNAASQISGAMRRFEEEMAGAEGQARLDEMKARVAGLIPEVITRDILINGWAAPLAP